MLVTSQPGTANSSLPSSVFCQKYSGTVLRQDFAIASSKVYFMFGIDGSSGYFGSTDSSSSRAELVAQHGLDLAVDLVGDRLVVLRVLHHELAHDARCACPSAACSPTSFSATRKLAYGSFGIIDLGSAVKMSSSSRKPFDGIEHLHGVGDRAAVDAGAVA